MSDLSPDDAARSFAKQLASRKSPVAQREPPGVESRESTIPAQDFDLDIVQASTAQSFPGPSVPPPSECVHISTATTSNPGTGYLVNDILTPIGGILCSAAVPFQIHVDAVDGVGGITAFTISVGDGYNTAPANPVGFSGGAGSSYQANCTFS